MLDHDFENEHCLECGDRHYAQSRVAGLCQSCLDAAEERRTASLEPSQART